MWMMSYYDGTDRLIIFDAIPPLKHSGTQAWRKNLEGFVAADNPGDSRNYAVRDHQRRKDRLRP